MNWGRTWGITLKVLRTLRRDRRGLALMVAGPILQMAVIGFVFGASVSHVRTVVVDQDQGPVGAVFVHELNATALDVSEAHSAKVAKDRVKDGAAWAAIILPPHFTELLTGNATEAAAAQDPGEAVTLVVDASNQQVAAAVAHEVQAALGKTLVEVAIGNVTSLPAAVANATALRLASRGGVPLTQDVVYGADAHAIDVFVAALMGFTVFIFTTITTVTAFVAERTSGMLARLQAGPLRPVEIVLGHALGYGLVAAVQGSALLAVAVLVYGIHVEGPVALAFGIVILLAICGQALGMLLSAAATRESQAIQMFPLVIVPAFVLSGTFVPVFSLPAFLRPLAYLVPIYWSSEALRSVLLRGWGLDRVWPHFVALGAFAALFLGLAVLMLVRQRRQ